MAKNPQCKIDANNRYVKKTYHKIHLQLNIERDDDMIHSINEAKSNGLSYREYLRELFDMAKI